MIGRQYTSNAMKFLNNLFFILLVFEYRDT